MPHQITKHSRTFILLFPIFLVFASCMGETEAPKKLPEAKPKKEILPTAPNVVLPDSSGPEPTTLSVDTSLKHHQP